MKSKQNSLHHLEKGNKWMHIARWMTFEESMDYVVNFKADSE
ncbi:unnamed protein product [Nezara viridula]|uniref:Uncharacterized protein n=1 Tax=Nezara viridula TaxID=85310 RepID=A0A9P0H2B3_NEZVI|nr:unnamed protein product [Nezara viridula]